MAKAAEELDLHKPSDLVELGKEVVRHTEKQLSILGEAIRLADNDLLTIECNLAPLSDEIDEEAEIPADDADPQIVKAWVDNFHELLMAVFITSIEGFEAYKDRVEPYARDLVGARRRCIRGWRQRMGDSDKHMEDERIASEVLAEMQQMDAIPHVFRVEVERIFRELQMLSDLRSRLVSDDPDVELAVAQEYARCFAHCDLESLRESCNRCRRTPPPVNPNQQFPSLSIYILGNMRDREMRLDEIYQEIRPTNKPA